MPTTVREQVSDVEFMAAAFGELLAEHLEFPIKVEGTRTLPYSAVVLEADSAQRTLVLKLFRPLPPALAMGACFDVVFAYQGKRYEGRINLQGREGYLRYRFGWPPALFASDRRLTRRFPFRPRENVYVTAQDAQVPCHGLTGPLANLSQGGFCFRLDRVIQLEDGLPIRPRANLFDPGRPLSLIRIHGIQNESLQARGIIVRVQEGNSEIYLAVQFLVLDGQDDGLLSRALAERERQTARGLGLSTGQGAAGRPAAGPRHDGAEEARGEPCDPGAPRLAGLEAMRRLERRTARLLLVARPEASAAILQRLRGEGFWRVEQAADLEAAGHAFKTTLDVPFRALLLDLEPSCEDGLEGVGAIRKLEPTLQAFPELPVAFITPEPDPMLELLTGPRLGAIAQEDPDPGRWPGTLDRLLGINPG